MWYGFLPRGKNTYLLLEIVCGKKQLGNKSTRWLVENKRCDMAKEIVKKLKNTKGKALVQLPDAMELHRMARSITGPTRSRFLCRPTAGAQ